MISKQIDLFNDSIEKDFDKSSLFTICNNKKVELSIEEIFDYNKYSKFIGVTYSISPEFINEYLQNFDNSIIVVGIYDDFMKSAANQMAKNIQAQFSRDVSLEAVNLFQNLSTSSKVKINNKKIEVRVPTPYTIHSKFYLLENDDGDNRIILGSANLSYQAFDKKIPQFENIIIFDNHPLYDLYKSYFENDLKPLLGEYFPSEVLKINSREIKKITKDDEINLDKVFALTNENIDKIRTKAPIDTIDNLKEKVAIGLVPDSVFNEMKNIDEDKNTIDNKVKEKQQIEELAYELVKESINPRLKKPNLKKNFDAPKIITRKINVMTSNFQDKNLTRSQLYSKPGERNISNGKTGLFVPLESNKNRLQIYGKKASAEEIEKSLKTLNNFMRTFDEYVYKYTDGYGERIMEVILYAFTSPFIYELKKMLDLPESRLDIPQFLFIGGTAGSGKSSLLKVLTKMIGLDNKPYWVFDNLYEGHNDKSNKINILKAWMSEENVNPILVDEINPWFFNNNNYGTDLIKTIANKNVNEINPFPVLIATTNSDGYSLPPEARRRSYFLKIDKIFDPDHRKDSQQIYQEIYNNIDSTLFLDFIYRMSLRIENKDMYDWNYFSKSCGLIDFLHQSREIFKEYYHETNMPIPRYFPEDRYNDDSESAQEKWRKLYKSSSQKFFTFDEKTNHMFFKLSTIDENSFQIYGGKKLSQVYADAIPQKILIGSSHGVTDLEFDATGFFEWIEELNPYRYYYKDKLKEMFQNNHFSFTINDDEIILDLNKLTEDSNMKNIYLDKIPKDIISKQQDNLVFLDKEKFYNWQGMEFKKTFFEKIFGK